METTVEVKTPTTTVYARSAGPLTPEKGARVSVWVRGVVNFYVS